MDSEAGLKVLLDGLQGVGAGYGSGIIRLLGWGGGRGRLIDCVNYLTSYLRQNILTGNICAKAPFLN